MKPVEIGRVLEIRTRFDPRVQPRVGHAKNRCHHRFRSFIPKVAVILDNAGVNFHVPVRHVDISYPLYLPELEHSICAIESEYVGGQIMFKVSLESRQSVDEISSGSFTVT
jgi:hypothetical protein